jgi:hypothetical protein
MFCRACKSNTPQAFATELAIHALGQQGLTSPLLIEFPKVLICLDCGFCEFGLPVATLDQMRQELVAK